jgi:regulator of cell morphogenesis and NO signaling
MMQTQVTKTVREIALESTTAPAVLEAFGIDYCCGGHVPFEEACKKAGQSTEAVIAKLEQASRDNAARTDKSTDWQSEPLSELIGHINKTHHVFVRSECPRLLSLADKVATKHGPNKPELKRVHAVFSALAQELSVHLMKEEQILFPYIERLEEASLQKESAPPSACFGTVENPIRMMMFEHDNAGTALRELRSLTSDYTVPADGCMSYRALFEGLAAFEADLHQHIHLENNILFPRTVELSNSK